MTRIDLIKTDETRVARISMATGEISPMHYHSNLVEHVICLRGEIEVRLNLCEELIRLYPGDMHQIPPLERHCLMNPASAMSEYMLVQEGRYDFIAINA